MRVILQTNRHTHTHTSKFIFCPWTALDRQQKISTVDSCCSCLYPPHHWTVEARDNDLRSSAITTAWNGLYINLHLHLHEDGKHKSVIHMTVYNKEYAPRTIFSTQTFQSCSMTTSFPAHTFTWTVTWTLLHNLCTLNRWISIDYNYDTAIRKLYSLQYRQTKLW